MFTYRKIELYQLVKQENYEHQVQYYSKEKVLKLAEQSIYIVVLGFSSVTIIQEDIREELISYKVKHGKEVYAW
ncbi:hypothetical protein L1887_12698 [Cichorium endivia]|nr:hypothetical protein L1887_12698 [Cichorium endivia]